jgi:hypothetical protein
LARLHLFEIEDQSWCPRLLRDAATAYLRRTVEVTGHARLLVPKLAWALRRTGAKRLVDLCSGGAGPLPSLIDDLEQQGLPVSVRLTDRFPNLGEFESIAAASDGRIDYVAEPVDATATRRPLGGLRTLFNAFHHFRPDAAVRILQSAADAAEPIAVFEIVGRSPFALIGMLFAPLAVLVLIPTLRPRPAWLFFTYLVPLIPLLVLWDGLVSCLRVYSVPELRELVREVNAPGWQWDAGRIRLGAAPAWATYLIGYPPDAQAG